MLKFAVVAFPLLSNSPLVQKKSSKFQKKNQKKVGKIVLLKYNESKKGSKIDKISPVKALNKRKLYSG